MTGKRIVFYDAADKSFASKFWRPGGKLYKAAGMTDEVIGVGSWRSLFQGLGQRPSESVSQVEVWCHGMPGRAYIDGKTLRLNGKGHLHFTPYCHLAWVYNAMAADGVFWLRSCYSFAGPIGKAFAEQLASETGCTAAGHTHLIGPWQAGFRAVAEGGKADWSAKEGGLGQKSYPWSPRCIPAWVNKIPTEWIP